MHEGGYMRVVLAAYLGYSRFEITLLTKEKGCYCDPKKKAQRIPKLEGPPHPHNRV